MMRALFLVAIAGIAAAIAALWALGSALSAPAMHPVGPPPAALRAEPVAFESDSGSTIHAWLVRGDAGRGAVVLAHSVRSSRLEMLARADFLRRAGYSLLLFDAQAHGESPGERITFGHLESLDAEAAVGLLHARLPGEPIGYLGVSQGGAAALLGPEPLEVQALILEAVYPTLREAVIDRIAIRLGPVAALLAPLLLVQVEPRLGIDPASVAPIEGIRRIRAPLLLVAGELDRHTPLSESRRLFDAAPEPKTLWVLPGAAHVDFHRFGPAEYERQILAFLSGTLGQRAGARRPPS
jgi:fermentation-respiration switch protein FrsA (DUF1100 family)